MWRITVSEQVDLLVKGRVVDVNTGTLEDRSIAVDDGEIVAFGERPASRVIEAAYVTPGLIDAHTHIEASMVTIPQYGNAVVPHGVTSVVHDPHEIANVLGPAGVRNFSADADSTPLKADDGSVFSASNGSAGRWGFGRRNGGRRPTCGGPRHRTGRGDGSAGCAQW